VIALLGIALAKPVFADENALFYPSRSDWSDSRGKTNLSVFVFNDTNGNGIFDVGDRALADIATGLRKDRTPLSVVRTNISGFANYPTSVSQKSVTISEIGNYDFEVFIPPGWRITTQNQVQQREIELAAGSISGLGMAEMLHPVGLEQIRFIRGTYGLPNAGQLELWQNGSLISEAQLSVGEEFLFPVAPGAYQLISENTRRAVRVGSLPVDIGTFNRLSRTSVSGQNIDFEALAPYRLQKLPNGYNNLNWFNLNVIRASVGDVGYVNGATSGSNVLYTSSGLPASISANTNFDFVQANLSVAWPQAEGEQIILSFYRGEALVLQDKIGLSAYGPISYQPFLPNITRIELSTAHNWQAVLDDIVVNIAR